MLCLFARWLQGEPKAFWWPAKLTETLHMSVASNTLRCKRRFNQLVLGVWDWNLIKNPGVLTCILTSVWHVFSPQRCVFSAVFLIFPSYPSCSLAPVSVHAAFDKAAHYFGMKLVHIPLDKKTMKVDVKVKARPSDGGIEPSPRHLICL